MHSRGCREIALRAKKSHIGEAKELHLYRGQEIVLMWHNSIAVLRGIATAFAWGKVLGAAAVCPHFGALQKLFPSAKPICRAAAAPRGGGEEGRLELRQIKSSNVKRLKIKYNKINGKRGR